MTEETQKFRAFPLGTGSLNLNINICPSNAASNAEFASAPFFIYIYTGAATVSAFIDETHLRQFRDRIDALLALPKGK